MSNCTQYALFLLEKQRISKSQTQFLRYVHNNKEQSLFQQVYEILPVGVERVDTLNTLNTSTKYNNQRIILLLPPNEDDAQPEEDMNIFKKNRNNILFTIDKSKDNVESFLKLFQENITAFENHDDTRFLTLLIYEDDVRNWIKFIQAGLQRELQSFAKIIDRLQR